MVAIPLLLNLYLYVYTPLNKHLKVQKVNWNYTKPNFNWKKDIKKGILVLKLLCKASRIYSYSTHHAQLIQPSTQ